MVLNKKKQKRNKKEQNRNTEKIIRLKSNKRELNEKIQNLEGLFIFFLPD